MSAAIMERVRPACACATHNDGTRTVALCPLHADADPCGTAALVTGKRRRGSVVRGCCSSCGWSEGGAQ